MAICGREVWCHCIVALCHVVFVSLHNCPRMVVHHYHHVVIKDEVIPGGVPWYWWVFRGLIEVYNHHQEGRGHPRQYLKNELFLSCHICLYRGFHQERGL